jgi:hypothetical protein
MRGDFRKHRNAVVLQQERKEIPAVPSKLFDRDIARLSDKPRVC